MITCFDLEVKYRPVAFCLTLAFAFRYTSMANPTNRRIFNYITFLFILFHMGLKAYENTDDLLKLFFAPITVVLFHFFASIIIPAFVFYHASEIVKNVVDSVAGLPDFVMEFLPPIVVLIVWSLLFGYVDQGVIQLMAFIPIFTPLYVSDIYKIGSYF